MRHHRLIALISIFLFLAIPHMANAALAQPFGGRVLRSRATEIAVCAAQYGPIIQLPYNASPTGPYFIRAGLGGAPRTGGYILGLYSSIPDFGSCVNPFTGFPVPALSIEPLIYGVSR